MKKLISTLATATSVAMLMAVVAIPASVAFASSIDMVQTVASAPAGANTQTLATSTVTANVPQVKATRTITANSVPVVPVTLTLGTCAISITSSTTPDVDCSNNNAAIATSTDTTAALIAARIRTITGLSDTGHGALTVGGSGATASFTTTGTETASTSITATLSTGSDFTLTTVNTTGVIPVAQVFAITPANVETGDTFTVVVNGTSAAFTATAPTIANVTAGLTAAINASAASTTVTASNQSTAVNVTAKTAGTAFTINTATATNLAAIAQAVTFTPTILRDYIYTITLNGVNYSATGTNSSTAKSIVEDLNAALSGNPTATCSEDDVKITCVGVTPGTAFTYDSSIAASSTPAPGGGGGGGGSHATTANNGTTKANPAAPAQDNANAHAAFNRDLKVGATGADVMSLQVYLNAHGYLIASTGAGSKGMETTYFGKLTQAALAKMQAANGIMPAVGYFGPKTRAYVAAH